MVKRNDRIGSELGTTGLDCDIPEGTWSFVGRAPTAAGEIAVVLTWSAGLPPVSRDDLREAFGLTPRQAHVAQLLYLRRTNAEISRFLGIEFKTTKNHVEQVLVRIGVRNRMHVNEAIDRIACDNGFKTAANISQVRRQSPAALDPSRELSSRIIQR